MMEPMSRRSRLISMLCTAGLLAVAGCAAHASAAGQGAPGTGTHAPRAGTRTASCPAPPARHAWAGEVSLSGQAGWRTSLATHDNDVSPAVEPLVYGTVAVLAQDGSVHGLRLASGQPLWSFTGGQSVYGMWRWQDLVIVLTDQVSDHARLTGLDAATGAVRWTLRLPEAGLIGTLSATGDGGLAMLRGDGTLQVVSLADGAVRWKRPVGTSPALAAGGGLVFYGINGRLTAYDAQTGGTAWTTSGLPPQPAVQLAGGLLMVTSNVQGGDAPTALTAVVPGTGRVAWRFDPGTAVTVLAAGVLTTGPTAGIAVATYDPRRLYLLDPGTGRPRWRVAVAVTFSVLDGGVLVDTEGFGPVHLVERSAVNGAIRWQDTLAEQPAGPAQAVVAGQLILVPGIPEPASRPAELAAYRLDSGGQVWRLTLPAPLADSPVLLPGGGLLIQPADFAYACAVSGLVTR
jgi:outer membrane protein assembly factor BamB